MLPQMELMVVDGGSSAWEEGEAINTRPQLETKLNWLFAEWRTVVVGRHGIYIYIYMYVVKDFKRWRKAMEKVFEDLLGIYEMLDKHLELLENEKTDKEKSMGHNLEWNRS